MTRLARIKRGAAVAGMLVVGCKVPGSPVIARIEAIDVAPTRLSLLPFQAAPLTIHVLTGQSGVDATSLLQWSTTGGSIVNNGTIGGIVHITYTSPSQPGNYLLIVTTALSTPADTAAVTVTSTPVPVHTVVVTPGSASLRVGDTTRFSTTLTDSTGSMLYGRAITWSLSDSTVATIAITGYVQAIAAGTTTVRATCEGRTGTAVVTVAP